MFRRMVLSFLFVSFSIVGLSADLDTVLKNMKDKYKTIEDQVRTIKMTAKTTADFENKEVVTKNVTYKKGNKMRVETEPIKTIPEIPEEYLTAVNIYDGENLWIISQGETQKLPVSQTEMEQGSPLSDVSWIEDLKDKISLDGEETVDGVDCYVLKMSQPYKLSLYISKDSYDWIKMVQSIKGQTLEILRRDFRPVEGVSGFEVPYEIDVKLNGTPVTKTEVLSVSVNEELPDTLFVVRQKPVKKESLPSKGKGEKGSEKKEKREPGNAPGDAAWSDLEKLSY